MNWLKRTLVAFAVVLVVAILLTAVGYRQLHGEPAWYASRSLSAGQLEAAAHSAENKLTNMQNWAAEQHARETAGLGAKEQGGASAATTGPAVAATKPAAENTTTIEFTEDELNAFFQKWVATTGWADKFGNYVTDPGVFLQDGRVILAGKLKDLGTVASVQFEPKLVAGDTKLDLQVVRVLGGNLPLPKAVWASQRDKLAKAASAQLPQWQRQATIAPNGMANVDAVSAGLIRALLHVLNEEPSEPVVFLPVAGHGAIPARLTAVSIVDKTLSVSVTPMTPVERQAFLERLKGGGAKTETTASVR